MVCTVCLAMFLLAWANHLLLLNSYLQLRLRLEESLGLNLKEYRHLIDEETIVIMRQMDAPSEIFSFLYLGSEWNASNLEELQQNGWVGLQRHSLIFQWFSAKLWYLQCLWYCQPISSHNIDYRKVSNIRRTKCQNLNDSRLVLQLSVPNPLKPSVKSIMKM